MLGLEQSIVRKQSGDQGTMRTGGGRVVGVVLQAILLSLLSAGVALTAQAQTYTYSLLHTFVGRGDGASPYAGLIEDSAGNFYGTSYYGGKYGLGSVFKMDSIGNVTILHSCAGGTTDGEYVWGGLFRDAAGNLYGTTQQGGTYGYGTVFEYTSAGKWKLLYSFVGQFSDGSNPEAGVIRDAAGNLYGTTVNGGENVSGVVFKLTATGKESVLYNFTGRTDGRYPTAALVTDPAGNFYGTTTEAYGGPGSIFKLAPNGAFTLLYAAGSCCEVLRDSAGDVYGVAGAGAYNEGEVFEVNTSGTASILFSFNDASDGAYAPLGGLIRDGQGNIYGTTAYGGTYNQGTVYKLAPDGTETVLYNFAGYPNDGSYPYAAMTLDAQGNLYGTTASGGSADDGTVFKLARTRR